MHLVGYQNKDVASKGTIYLNTFLSVSKGTAMTLGDITANPYDDSDGTYDVWDWTGFTPFIDFVQTMNTSGRFTGKYTYAPAGYAGTNNEGWYEYEDTSCSAIKNDISLPFTHGFVLHAGDGTGGISPVIAFAGQVKSDATVVPVENASMLTGNCSPVDITLGRITANSYNDEDGSYDVWDWTGFTPFVDFIQIMNDEGKFVGKYTYAPAGYAGSNIAGWYEYEDTACKSPMNNVEVKAGQAFVVVAGDGAGGIAPTITIPSAL